MPLNEATAQITMRVFLLVTSQCSNERVSGRWDPGAQCIPKIRISN